MSRCSVASLFGVGCTARGQEHAVTTLPRLSWQAGRVNNGYRIIYDSTRVAQLSVHVHAVHVQCGEWT